MALRGERRYHISIGLALNNGKVKVGQIRPLNENDAQMSCDTRFIGHLGRIIQW